MTATDTGTVLITGPTRGLGRALTLKLAGRAEPERPDLLLVGRPGERLTEVAGTARAAGATVHEIPCEMSRLADVRAAAATAQDLLATGAVRPLRALVGVAGLTVSDTRTASADGYEMTFAVNYLAHAQLIGDLIDSFEAPARIVLIGSDTYNASRVLQMMGVPAAEWRDPVDLARPALAEKPSGSRATGVAYSNSKLAILYYAHELQRRVGEGIGVAGLARLHARHRANPGAGPGRPGDAAGHGSPSRDGVPLWLGAGTRLCHPRRSLGASS